MHACIGYMNTHGTYIYTLQYTTYSFVCHLHMNLELFNSPFNGHYEEIIFKFLLCQFMDLKY